MSISRRAHVGAIPALTTILCIACTAAMATSIPAELPGAAGSDGAFALFAGPAMVTESDTDFDTTLVASAAAFGTSLDLAESSPSDSTSPRPSRGKGLTTLSYAATAAGIAAGLVQALSGAGSASTALTAKTMDRNDAPAQEPIPEPTTLVLAALACSSALISLLRRRSRA